ncbi:DNA polymerase III subunit delta [Candidatus Saganbacteria bacterium]|nr:DNA polymerase III subunit delta [Candidatus Saganbacteria bacterium]
MIYLIYGEEQYLVRDFISRVIEKNKGAAIEKLDSPSLNSLVEIISIPSLFSPDRIIIAEDLALNEDSEKFASALQTMPPNLTLIIKKADGFDKRTKFYKTIEPICEIHEFKSIPEWEEGKLSEFVIGAFAKLNKKITRDNADILVENVGRNMALLNAEIEKISTYAGDKNTIEISDIEDVVTRSGWDSFAFVNLVVGRDYKNALKTIERLLSENEEPSNLLALASSQYRDMFKVKLLASNGASVNEIMGRMKKTSYYYINKLFMAVKHFRLEELEHGLERFYEADLKIKSGYSPRVVFPLLLSELMPNV